jgi:hypothetical protein
LLKQKRQPKRARIEIDLGNEENSESLISDVSYAEEYVTNYGNGSESSNIDLNSKDLASVDNEIWNFGKPTNVDIAKRRFGMKKIVGMKLPLT